MEYPEAVRVAPPGSRSFGFGDFLRLPRFVRDEAVRWVPVGEMRAAWNGDLDAQHRIVRAMFWPLVYHLAPERWDQLARAEPVHPSVLNALPLPVRSVLEVGAGSGRLTGELLGQADMVVAVEPSAGLRAALSRRHPAAMVVAGMRHRLPIRTGWADLTVACASLGPEVLALVEIERCTKPGGIVAIISPESPEWFARRGYNWERFDPTQAPHPARDPALEAFFGPLQSPRDLLTRRVGDEESAAAGERGHRSRTGSRLDDQSIPWSEAG